MARIDESELDETFFVNRSNATNATLADYQGVRMTRCYREKLPSQAGVITLDAH